MSCSRGCCESFIEHVRSVSVSAAATPTRRAEVSRIDATEKKWDADGDAYKRIRKQGLQPKDIDGCAQLEKHANDTVELDAGKPMDPTMVKKWKSSTSELESKGLIARAG